jgi:hypothetical protein
MSKTPSGPPVSRPPATTEYWECAGMVTGRAPVSRPAKTEKITELYSRGELTLVDPVKLGRSIVLTVALPAFAIGCLVGMLLF